MDTVYLSLTQELTQAVEQSFSNGEAGGLTFSIATSVESISVSSCDLLVFSMLLNGQIVEAVSDQLLTHSKSSFTHTSCSTIFPSTAKVLLEKHSNGNHDFIAAPVFARPDGISRREATYMIAGAESGRKEAERHLQLAGKVVDMGGEVGAANVVKLCGSFLIAVSLSLRTS
jgi:3-hydroxyisobutyrate dehydrogenase-like beta-hydroxyacid dehydrogenase